MAMPTIRVDDEVYERLKSDAEPFVDTPNSVLRRLLELDSSTKAEAAQPKRQLTSERMRPGDLLDRKVYDLRILEVLDEAGGSLYAPDVVEAVGKLVADQLTPNDWLENNSGVVRWKNRVAWRRFNLVRMGLLTSDSPRGIWQISSEGRQALERGFIDYSNA
jgi:negative regulator of replication initiation